MSGLGVLYAGQDRRAGWCLGGRGQTLVFVDCARTSPTPLAVVARFSLQT
jgi:hypothetical protein